MAPATVAVSTSAGSTSDAPVTIPGKMRCRKLPGLSPPELFSGAGHLTILSSWAAELLGDLWKLTSQVPFNSAFMPQAQWPGVINDPERSDGGEKTRAADYQKKAGRSCPRHLQDHQYVPGREQHGERQRKHAYAGQQAGGVLGPAPFGVVFSKQREAVGDQPRDHHKTRDNGDPLPQVHA